LAQFTLPEPPKSITALAAGTASTKLAVAARRLASQ
jgi:hypothetical protein